MKKKVLSIGIITILVMMLVLLTGCGNTENSSSNPDNSKSNKEESIKDTSIYGSWVNEKEDYIWVFDENEVYWSNNWYESYGTYTIKPNNKIQITLNKNVDFDGRNTEYTYSISDGKLSLISDDDSWDDLVKTDKIILYSNTYEGSGGDYDTHYIKTDWDGTCHVKFLDEKHNIDSDGTYTYTPKGRKIEITLDSGEVLNCVMDRFGINWTDENYLFYK